MKELQHTVYTKKANYKAEQWCISSIGPKWGVLTRKTGKWACFWRGPEKQYQWYFENEQDAIMFTLIWT